jgi:hypothetical protein
MWYLAYYFRQIVKSHVVLMLRRLLPSVRALCARRNNRYNARDQNADMSACLAVRRVPILLSPYLDTQGVLL